MIKRTVGKVEKKASSTATQSKAKGASRRGKSSAKSVAVQRANLSGQVTLESAPGVFRGLRQSFGLTQQAMHSLAGMSVRKISGLETGEQKPTQDDVRRFNELRRLREELAYIIAPEAIAEWLHLPNDYFGGMNPMQVIERGEADRLWRLIWRLQDGIPLE